MRQILFSGSISALLILILVACQKEPKPPEMSVEDRVQEAIETTGENEESFVVALKDEEDVIRGTVLLTEDKKGVHIDVMANHLVPGEYGFHIHEKGICEAPTFVTSGGHFNPWGKEHGLENEEGPHAGDLENLVVKEDGTVQQQIITDQITLQKGKKHSVFHESGTSLMMHKEEDDHVSQPAGDAGERMLCGVITTPSEQ